MNKKQPRAQTREGRPSPALGDQDHRARKTAVARQRNEEGALDDLEVPDDAPASQRALIDTLNTLIQRYNDGD
jgi:hypothetical protein